MVVKIQFPEPVGEELLRLPDRDTFVSSVVAQALELRWPGPTEESRLPPLNVREREDAWRQAKVEVETPARAAKFLVRQMRIPQSGRYSRMIED